MEYVFSEKSGIKLVIWDEGNNIIVSYISGGRVIKSGILHKNYRTGLCCAKQDDDIYVAFVSVENELVWNRLLGGEPLILFSDKSENWQIYDLNIIVNSKGVVLFYETFNQKENQTEIKYILPYGERRGKLLCALSDKLNEYKIFFMGDRWYLWYITEDKKTSKFFIMNMERISDITISECFLTLEGDFEIRLHNVENYYKNKYDELYSMTKEIQEEGKKWRELYYKNVKKI